MERRFLIVNPVSGKGKSITVSKEIEERLKCDNINYEMLYTKKSMDATNYVKELTRPNDIIYSIGGDGTLNEIVNGIIGLDRKLCVIPAGSGNDFYKTIANSEQGIKTDVGIVNGRHFINSFSIGIDADICDNTILFRKKYIPSSMIYNLSVLYTLLGYKSKNIDIGEENKDCTLISIMNGKYYGGGFKISPDAICNDGLLNVTIVDKKSKAAIIYLLTKLLKATHQDAKGVYTSKVKNLKITSNIDLLACIDGEMIRSNQYEIGIIPNAIELYKDEKIDIKKLLKK